MANDGALVKCTTTRRFIQDGLLYAELNHFLAAELQNEGYAGLELRITPVKTVIIINATRTKDVLGEDFRRINELSSVIRKRWGFQERTLEIFAEKVNNRGLSALAQAESLRFKLLTSGMPVRRACYGIVRNIMDSEARGCEVVVSGKIRGQRAKSMRFRDGYMVKSGNPAAIFTDIGKRTVLMKQGVLGIKVKIMLPHDPSGKKGPSKNLPDVVKIHELKVIEK